MFRGAMRLLLQLRCLVFDKTRFDRPCKVRDADAHEGVEGTPRVSFEKLYFQAILSNALERSVAPT